MLHVFESWEETRRAEILRTLFDCPELRCYPFVEIPLNRELFHVDVATASAAMNWQRYIFDRFDDFLAFVKSEEISNFRIALQTRRDADGNYQIKRITRIFHIEFGAPSEMYIFECSDGSVEPEGSVATLGDGGVEKECVWCEAT
ncbi:hypothetical protein [Pseudoduganella umbonata]|uniref:Uncharacterized protein n=1 Tax=Pseudoduganella umbonata TaxID=864828 RepID=A0A4P8HNT4_9BURK|nr:hypothetical protein [Pseudoduganella umbonata]MBB3219997.1 hypothetical protein [Pseudoduganella umbonata]QCP10005.1 hypothetical protein FCL38_05895 [Pseudoduganella umbonata]